MFFLRNARLIKTQAIIFCVFILISLCSFCGAAESNPAGLKHYTTRISENGLCVDVLDLDGNPVDLGPTYNGSSVRKSSAALPSAYDSRSAGTVTSIKDQGNTQTCWVFTSISCLEGSAVSQGLSSLADADYSETHLAWFANNPVSSDTGDLGNCDGTNLGADAFNTQGNWQQAAATLLKGTGAAPESSYKFSSIFRNGSPTAVNYAESARHDHSSATLASAYTLGDSDSVDAGVLSADIKSHIMANGCVGAVFYYNSYYAKDNGKYYYCNTSKETNHSVCIVGWDDNFSRTNFSGSPSHILPPSSDGAWLVKNSYGTSFGSDGYMWISYKDANLTGFSVFEAASPYAYDEVYQYDGAFSLDISALQSTRILGANVFTADDDGDVVSVAYRALPNTETTIYVYKNLTGAAPNTGTLAATAVKSTKYHGYYTAEISPAVHIESGEKFAIAISCRRSDKYYIPIEGTENGAVSAAGQSYIAYDHEQVNMPWSQANTFYGDIAVKAYVKNGAEHSHSYKTPEYKWSDDHAQCTAMTTCVRCGAPLSETAIVSVKTVSEPTCTQNGVIQYSAVFSDPVFSPQTAASYTASLGGHTWNSGEVITEPTCSAAGSVKYTCTRCGQTETDFVSPLTHDFSEWIVDSEPRESENGLKHRTCKTCGYSETETIPSQGSTSASRSNPLQGIIDFLRRVIELFRNLFS